MIIKEVIKNLNNLDDYDRTNNEKEQNAVKIAKFVLGKLNPDTDFEVEFNKVKIKNKEK